MPPKPRTRSRPTDDALAEQLREAGLRRTEPRVAVLRFLTEAGHPVAHAEAAAALGKRGFDRVSVYRVLVDLARAKILTRTDAGDHVWRFELQNEERSHYRAHPHFVCVTCGTVACLPEKSVQIGAATRAPRAVRAHDVEVQLKGECDRCAAAG